MGQTGNRIWSMMDPAIPDVIHSGFCSLPFVPNSLHWAVITLHLTNRHLYLFFMAPWLNSGADSRLYAPFSENLVLCNITEREPFHWVLINAHAVDEKDETQSRPSIQPSFSLKHGFLLFVLLSVMKLLINPRCLNLNKLLRTLWRYEVVFCLLQRKQRGALAR